MNWKRGFKRVTGVAAVLVFCSVWILYVNRLPEQQKTFFVPNDKTVEEVQREHLEWWQAERKRMLIEASIFSIVSFGVIWGIYGVGLFITKGFCSDIKTKDKGE